MDSWFYRALRKAIPVREDETAVALLMFAYSFLAMTVYNILKPITKSKAIDHLGADNLPYVLMGSSVLIGVFMHLYGSAARRLPRQHVVPLTQLAIIVLLGVFWVLLKTEAVWVTIALYFFGQILGILLISQFWTLANDIYDARQAKRLFGLIGGGACLGGALGNSITAITISDLGPNNLLLVSAAILAGCVAIVRRISRLRPVGDHAEFDEDIGVGGREALRLLAQSRQLRVLAAVVALAVMGAAVVDQQLNMAAEAFRVDEESIAALLAQVGAYLSLFGFVVQIGLTSRIHRSWGITAALLLLPVSLGASATFILLTGSLVAVGGARVLDGTLRYSLDKTTREVLFLPVPPGLRFRAKPFIDVTMEKFGKALAAVLILVLIRPWGLGLDWRSLSYASLVMTAVWIAVALLAWREYLRAFRASIGARTIAPGTIRTEVDPATIETLVEELSHPDEQAVLYAIEMLEALDKRHLVTPLLLQHQSARVRARTLRALTLSRSRAAGGWLPTVTRMVQDEDVDVRAAALRALAELEHEDAAVLMRRHLTDTEPRVVVTSAITLANSARPDDVAAADAALRHLIADQRDIAAAGRAEAATALAHIDDPRFRFLLVPLLYDRDTGVVHKAIRSARKMGASDGLFVPGLLSLLGHRGLKGQAREALVGYGEPIIGALAHALRDQREHVWIRRHIPATLAQLGTQGSMDALVAALDDPDGFLRYKAIAAIEKIRREHPAIACPRPVLESQIVRESSRYYNGLTLQHNLLRHVPDGDDSLLARALQDKLHRTIDRIYRLLGLLYHVDDVAAARYTIEQGETRRRAAAVEYLDNLLGGVVRKRVMPILDDSPLTDKVRYANAVLKSRPRDLEDTLAQLVHEDDPVVAAAAIHFVGQRRIWGLTDDLEYVAAHRSADDDVVLEAVTWALAAKHSEPPSALEANESLPIVELADRVRVIPLFVSLSVDELFRIAQAGEEVRHSAGRELCHSGTPAADVLFLLEGGARTIDGVTAGTEIVAPAVIGFEDVLQGTSLRSTVRAIESTVCFRIAADDFLTMVSDNILLAQSLFGLLLANDRPRAPFSPPHVSHDSAPPGAATAARFMRQDPLLSRASAAQLLALTAVAPEVPLKAGAVLFDIGTPPAIYQIVQGEVMLEHAGTGSLVAPSGATIGVADTLAGTASAWRATVTRDGRAIRLDRDELFSVLADHVDLMQGLFCGVLALRDADTRQASLT